VTRTANARLAGATFLVYIGLAFPSMVLYDRATSGRGIAAKLSTLAEHAADMRVSIVLAFVTCFAALVLAVTLYAITRDEDADWAMLGLTCRVGEGLNTAISLPAAVALLWLATTGRESVPVPETSQAIAALLLRVGTWSTIVGSMLFAVGSTCFSYLFLRGRIIPVALAWIGVLASVLLVVALPLRLVDVVSGSTLQFLWLPMAAFEIPLGLWLLFKGAAAPRPHRSTT